MMTPRYKLRTLLILLAILPPLLWFGWTKYEAWRAEQLRQQELREAKALVTANVAAIKAAIAADRLGAAIAEQGLPTNSGAESDRSKEVARMSDMGPPK